MSTLAQSAGVRVTLLVVAAAVAGFGGGVGATFVHPAQTGKQGVAGPSGPVGLQGPPGAQGAPGPAGQSASADTVSCQANTGGWYEASSPATFTAVVVGLGRIAGDLEYGNLTITCTVSP